MRGKYEPLGANLLWQLANGNDSMVWSEDSLSIRVEALMIHSDVTSHTRERSLLMVMNSLVFVTSECEPLLASRYSSY